MTRQANLLQPRVKRLTQCSSCPCWRQSSRLALSTTGLIPPSFGMSPATPLREALGLAERDGFVQYFPNRGWFVTKFSPPEIREIFVIRSGLENLAAELTIDHLTEREFAELQAKINDL